MRKNGCLPQCYFIAMNVTVKTKTQFKSGQKVSLEGKIYQVLSSIDLKWLGRSKKEAYLTNLKFLYEEEIPDKNVPHGTNAEQNSSALN